MSDYIDVPTDTQPPELAERAFEIIQTYFPEWTPNPGNFETILIQSVAEMAAEVKDVSSRVPKSIFRYFGEALANIPPLDAVAATVDTTWALNDSLGHVIPAGTQVVIRSATDTQIGFEVVDDVTVPPGSASTTAGQVELRALIDGTGANGLPGPAVTASAIAWVNSITMVGVPAGGVDAETDDEFLGRLVDELRIQSPRPLLPQDWAVLTRTQPGVARAVAIDLYDPVTDTGGHEKYITIAVVDENGNDLSSGARTAIKNYLLSLRGENFVVNVINARDRVTINSTLDVHPLPGFDGPALKTAVEAAITSYLSPANWGQSPIDESPFWINSTVVRINKIIQVAEDVEGVDYVENVHLNGGTSNINLTGPAPLTDPGTITATIV